MPKKTLTITKPRNARFTLKVNGKPVAKYEFCDATSGGPEILDVVNEKAWEELLAWAKEQPAVMTEVPGLPEPWEMPYDLTTAVHDLYNLKVFGKTV